MQRFFLRGRQQGLTCLLLIYVLLLLNTSAHDCPVSIESSDECAAPKLGYRLQGSVERIEWPSDENARVEFIRGLVTRDRPVLITNAPATKWRASQWDEVYLREHLKHDLIGVKRSTHPARVFNYFKETSPWLAFPGMVSQYHQDERVFTRHDMSIEDFFGRIRHYSDAKDTSDGGSSGSSTSPPPPNEGLFQKHPTVDGVCASETCSFVYSGPIRKWPALRAEALEVAQELSVPMPDWQPGEPAQANPWVWMGGRGAVTGLHHDSMHNLFLHIRGRKHWLLFPPAAIRQLYIYPYLHPNSCSSQLASRLNQPVTDELRERFPQYQAPEAWEVTMQPGDVLFVPALWLHHVTTLETPSISLAIHSHDRVAELVEAIMATNVPYPYTDETDPERYEKLAVFLRVYLWYIYDSVYPAKHASNYWGNVKTFVKEVLLHSRYGQTTSPDAVHRPLWQRADYNGPQELEKWSKGDTAVLLRAAMFVDEQQGSATSKPNNPMPAQDVDTPRFDWTHPRSSFPWLPEYRLEIEVLRGHPVIPWNATLRLKLPPAAAADAVPAETPPASSAGSGASSGSEQQPEQPPRFCHHGTLQTQIIQNGFAMYDMRTASVGLLESMRTIRTLAGDMRLEVVMADWIEKTLARMVGANFVARFLYDFVHC